MKVKVTKYENVLTLDGEINRLKQLAEFVEADNFSAIRENLTEYKKKKKSGIYAQIETDIVGY